MHTLLGSGRAWHSGRTGENETGAKGEHSRQVTASSPHLVQEPYLPAPISTNPETGHLGSGSLSPLHMIPSWAAHVKGRWE